MTREERASVGFEAQRRVLKSSVQRAERRLAQAQIDVDVARRALDDHGKAGIDLGEARDG